MTDAPMTIAEMREEAEAILRDWEGQAEEMDTRNPIRAQIMLEAAFLRKCIRAIPLPADDAEMVEKVARAICEADGNTATPEPGFSWGGWKEYIPEARAALSAMRGEP